METELHWPEMKAIKDLDFHCTSIFNYRLFLHQHFHKRHIIAAAERVITLKNKICKVRMT